MGKNLNLDKAFTLIELLIVIAIIGLLASVVLISFPLATKKARDAQRLQDMSQIVRSIWLYHSMTGNFPGNKDNCCSGWDNGPCYKNNEIFIKDLVTNHAVSIVPVDPKGGPNEGCSGYAYSYYHYLAGSYGCDASKGSFFVLGIRKMESRTGIWPGSPGWKCSKRNWQSEFAWVTGGFDKEF